MIQSKAVNWKEISGGYRLAGILSTNTTSTIIIVCLYAQALIKEKLVYKMIVLIHITNFSTSNAKKYQNPEQFLYDPSHRIVHTF